MTENRETNRNNDSGKMWPAIYIPLVFVEFSLAFWVIQDSITSFIVLTVIGLSVSAGFIIQAKAKAKQKRLGHKLSRTLVGLSHGY